MTNSITTSSGSNPQIFSMNGFTLRAITLNNDPWFVAADACRSLDLSDVSRAVSRLDDDEKGTTSIRTPGGDQVMMIVNEPGLYSLIGGSRKPEAKTFKRWINHEVLPALRKTGTYSISPTKLPSTLEVIENMVALAREHEDRMKRIEARQDAVDEKAQYFTVIGYALYINRHIDKGTAGTLGKRASALSKQQSIPMGKAKDTAYGNVNTYHESILKEVFDNWFVQFSLLEF